LQPFIGGNWIPSGDKRTFETVDPGSGDVLAELYEANADDVDAAVLAARKAFRESGWAQMSPDQRGVYLHRLADLVEDHRATLAELESLDVGKPLPQAAFDIANFSQTMKRALSGNRGAPAHSFSRGTSHSYWRAGICHQRSRPGTR
jgi:acyl-CoA reductase-like NAD-dependent aldehyde dehydrogenase